MAVSRSVKGVNLLLGEKARLRHELRNAKRAFFAKGLRASVYPAGIATPLAWFTENARTGKRVYFLSAS